MQITECEVRTRLGISHHQLFTTEGRFSTALRARQDDCSMYDKLPKQIDDIIEGESPKRFKRPKMESDIVAR